MAYVPLNVNVYSAAFAGAMAVMCNPAGAAITDPLTADYAPFAAAAAAWAQAVDVAWTAAPIPNSYDVQCIQQLSAAYHTSHPIAPSQLATFSIQANWTIPAVALVAAVRQGDANFTTQGIVPPSAQGGSSLSFTNIVALGNFVVPTDLAEGTRIWVDSVKDSWTWQPNNTATPNGITIVPAPIGIGAQGRWFRECIAWPGWTQGSQRINAWTISAAGNDDNPNGNINTFSELRRRFGKNLLLGDATTNILTVSISKDIPVTDPFVVDFNLSSQCYLQFIGIPSVVATGTVTTHVARNIATNTPNSLTSAIVPDFTPYVEAGFMLQGLSGTIADYYSWAALPVAGGARTGSWYNGSLAPVEAQPTDGNSFRIVRLPHIHGYYVVPSGGTIQLRELMLDVVGPDWMGGTTYVLGLVEPAITFLLFTRCAITLAWFGYTGNYYADNCQLVGDAQNWDADAELNAGVVVHHDFAGGAQDYFQTHHSIEAGFYSGTLFQGMQISATNATYLRIDDAGIFDISNAKTAAAEIHTFSYMRASQLWGNTGVAGAPYGVFASEMWTRMAATNNCTLTGSVNDVFVNGTAMNWAAARPFKTDLLNPASDFAGASI